MIQGGSNSSSYGQYIAGSIWRLFGDAVTPKKAGIMRNHLPRCDCSGDTQRHGSTCGVHYDARLSARVDHKAASHSLGLTDASLIYNTTSRFTFSLFSPLKHCFPPENPPAVNDVRFEVPFAVRGGNRGFFSNLA